MKFHVLASLLFLLVFIPNFQAQGNLNQATNKTGIGTNAPLERLHVHGNILQTHLELTPIAFPGRPIPEFKTSEATFQLSALSSTANVQSPNIPLNFDNTFHGTISFRVFANHKQNLRRFTIKAEHPNMPISFYSQENESVRIDGNGNLGTGQRLGIGTFEPAGALHILKSGSPPSGLPSAQNGLLLGIESTRGYKWIQSYGGALSLNPKGNGVGIGLSNPRATLHVLGSTQFDGVMQVSGRVKASVVEITGGSDLAEPFPIDGPIEPGMVVVIDPEKEGGLKPASEAYDKKVVGIVSGANNLKPGISLKQTASIADGENLIALVGRVYCYVDASYGAIEPGDFLTSSPKKGYAMKVTDHEQARGAIIGKAMTSLSEGKGMVLVLISLQ